MTANLECRSILGSEISLLTMTRGQVGPSLTGQSQPCGQRVLLLLLWDPLFESHWYLGHSEFLQGNHGPGQHLIFNILRILGDGIGPLVLAPRSIDQRPLNLMLVKFLSSFQMFWYKLLSVCGSLPDGATTTQRPHLKSPELFLPPCLSWYLGKLSHCSCRHSYTMPLLVGLFLRYLCTVCILSLVKYDRLVFLWTQYLLLMILVQFFSDTGRISNVNHLSYLHPIQGVDFLWHYLCLILLPCLLLFQASSQQLLYGCHHNVVLDAVGFFQDSGFGTHQTPPSLLTCFSMQMAYLHSALMMVYLSQ